MNVETNNLKPGVRVRHTELGEGVVIAAPVDGFIKVFFPVGERQVPVTGLASALSRSEIIVSHAKGDNKRALRAWLCYQAHALPLMDNVSALTSAKIDLLPHQVVLTHRVATASPRRFLIADEVGLGKTIEAALILRELVSRGELKRALMVVPAGLVNNWHRELNEVFHLNFEVFGSEGDVTDRKSNAFEKHNLLIASIDTLKLRARVARLKAAPPWDLVVFDEAHHLTARRQNGKLVKTQNFRLAETLKEHTRDLLLLSATPHQGDHFRFWMLVQMLDPTLFNSPQEMVEHRHRLNAVVFRRTKADACKPDGSTLFARRQVHTEAFTMADTEKVFYEALVAYLQDGFALAKRQGKRGQGLAFVMTIFQKIAASSFAAVQRTLRRRLIALTIQESLMHDQKLDIDQRNAALDEARTLIRDLHGIAEGRLENAEVDRLLADYRYKILKLQREEEEALGAGADEFGSETGAADAEDAAISSVAVALPEERRRIKELLATYPAQRETKVEKLIGALGVLWRQNPQERMVIFATYLGSVEMIGAEIEKQYPGQGVTVLKGGDHGAKTAAEKRFKAPDGPRVLICTAAGREGINLQHARVLFNFDLPWNPMDLEQRIGRIHRYGQLNTAQVYNLVLSDTIEGSIFLLLDEKLKEIGRALGKVDERGQIAEDLRTQILGQLSLQVNYASLYADALNDPSLKRTKVELDAAMSNAVEARKVVFELFQDLDGFRLDDYKAMGSPEEGMGALVRFVTDAASAEADTFTSRGDKLFAWIDGDTKSETLLTTERELSLQKEKVQLLGLDHPIVTTYLRVFRDVAPEQLGVRVQSPDGHSGVLAAWAVEARGDKGQVKRIIVPLAVDAEGKRLVAWERHPEKLWHAQPSSQPGAHSEKLLSLLRETLEPMLHRELEHRGLLFLVMEYCACGSARDAIESRKVSPTEALNWIQTLAEALDFVHDKKIIHHDIKPDNILVTENGTLKISDFGIANIGGGTRAYMSPEALTWDDNSVLDARVDIYALGVTLLELLTGQNPFFYKSPEEIQAMHDQGDFPIKSLPGWQQEIILKAINKVPELRFQSMGDFAAAIKSKHVPLLLDKDAIRAGQAAERAERSLSTKKWTRAGSLLEFAAQKYPNNVNVLRALGRFHLMQQKIGRAKSAYEKAIKLNPRIDVQKDLGWINLALKDYPAAISLLSDHLHRNPSDLEAHNLLLQCFYETDRHDVAISLARSILDIEPNNPCFANNYYIATLLHKMGQKIPPGDLLGEYTNDFIAYNFSVVSESVLTHAWQKSPTLKSKLLFMDYRFRKLTRSPLFISDDPTAAKKPRPINKLIITFGREGYQVNDVQVAGSTSVSRRHCVVVNCRNDVWLYDLESTGTHVNGVRVKGKLPLIGRNIVRVGSKEFVITNDKDNLI